MATFTEKELRIYEAEIRKKPLPMLRDELLEVINDPTPERQNFVKARIAALEDREKRINTAKEKEQQKVLQEIQEKIRTMKQPMPDKEGLQEFRYTIIITLAIFIVQLLFHRHGIIRSGIQSGKLPYYIQIFDFARFLGICKFLPAIGIFLWYSCFIPFCRKFMWNDNEPLSRYMMPSYWLIHFKLALSIASFFLFFSLETIAGGNYNGLFYTGYGLPAYIIGVIYLISSILFIANTFYPLSKKFRPKNGLTLLAFAAATEAIVSAFFS